MALRPLKIGLFLSAAFVTLGAHAWNPFAAKAKPVPAKPKSQLILLAVDGLSYDAYQVARSRGLFKELSKAGAHVSPFPTMTDLSWANMMHTSKVFGDQGRIKNVEATYFDDSSQAIKGDPRDYYHRLAHPKYYFQAFEHYFNPYLEALVYFPTEEIPKMEIRSVVDALLASKPQPILTGYIGSVDSTAHTQKDRLFPILVDLDKEIDRLAKGFRAKGIEPDIVMVSDHGNKGRFVEGQAEAELISVDIEPVVKAAGLNFVQQLIEPNDAAIPLLALGTWAPVYLKERQRMRGLIEEFIRHPWFEHAIYINRNNADALVMTVISAQGRAAIRYDKKAKTYAYTPVEGNPLGLYDKWVNRSDRPVLIPENQSMAATAGSPYPDSLHRIIQAGSFENFDFPDMIITLKDGHFIKGPLAAMTKMYRTHGSLSAGSSLGVVATNLRDVPAWVRGEDLLGMLGVEAKGLYGKIAKTHAQSPTEALSESVRNLQRGIETKAQDFSQKRIFQHLQKFISDSRPFFVVNEMSAFKDAFRFDPLKNPGTQTLNPMNFDISKFDVTSFLSNDDIGALTDVVIRSPELDQILQNPRVQQLRSRIDQLVPTQQSQMELNLEKNGLKLAEQGRSYLLPARRSVMKLYQMPYLLERSLVIQEKSYLPESRHLQWARSWWVGSRSSMNSSLHYLQKVALTSEDRRRVFSAAEVLFREILKENELEDKIYPTALDKIYNHKLSRRTTVVYVPGIYNNLFDREIFSLGLNAIADDLNLRTLTAPVQAICSSDVNADLLLDYLKKDMATQVARGGEAPRYLILGYSKGGVDALAAFAKDPDFTAENVLGLVTIASPLQGSSILNKSDVPFALVSALSENSGPEICREDKTASKSISPVAMQTFWRRHGKALTGLTRYFSISFVSEPENSHLFMRATKMIAQFDEDNDGVVTLSASKFPDALSALDLGTVQADHLAGILASRFNQKAFLRAIVNTMAELDLENIDNNFKINSGIIIQPPDSHAHSAKKIYDVRGSTSTGFVLHSMEFSSGGPLPKQEQRPVKNTAELNRLLLPKVKDPADDYEPQVRLAPSQLKYDPYNMLDIAKLGDTMAKTRVQPTVRQSHPKGIDITYNHRNVVHFRMDHQFNWESRTPGGMDDNPQSGWAPSRGSEQDTWAVLRSKNNSIRLTTLAYRFNPTEFSKFHLKLAVTKGVKDADPVKGKSGIDDSAFQVWLSIREKNTTGDRSLLDAKQDNVLLFGYYWGDPVPGETRPAGSLFENSWSKRSILTFTLPEAHQILLNDESMLGKQQIFERNLAEDLTRAFPGRDVRDMEVIAITIQHDSNDAKDRSEAYFKFLRFLP